MCLVLQTEFVGFYLKGAFLSNKTSSYTKQSFLSLSFFLSSLSLCLSLSLSYLHDKVIMLIIPILTHLYTHMLPMDYHMCACVCAYVSYLPLEGNRAKFGKPLKKQEIHAKNYINL